MLVRSFFGLLLDEKFPNERQYGAKYALIVLMAMNALNFADRAIPDILKQSIIDDIPMSDFESAIPSAGLIIGYMLFALVFGSLNDYQVVDRRLVMFVALLFWSVCTALLGLSQNLWQLTLLRTLVGIGEAAFVTTAAPMLADFYPFQDRHAVYGFFYYAIPFGGALGFLAGALLGSAFGWRVALFVCIIPSLILTYFALRLNNPVRGINDRGLHPEENTVNNTPVGVQGDLFAVSVNENDGGSDGAVRHSSASSSSELGTAAAIAGTDAGVHVDNDKKTTTMENISAFFHDVKIIFSHPHYVLATMGLAANNFALGGASEWLATFFIRNGMPEVTAGLVIAISLIFGGGVGVILGVKLTAHFDASMPNAAFSVPATFTVLAAICFLIVTHCQNVALIFVFLFLMDVCFWTNIGPIYSVSTSTIPPRLRSRSRGIQVFVEHLFGDISAPLVIGYFSGTNFQLLGAIQLVWLAMLASGVAWALAVTLPPVPTPFDHLINETSTSPLVVSKVPHSSFVNVFCKRSDLILSDGELYHRGATEQGRESVGPFESADKMPLSLEMEASASSFSSAALV